MKDKQAKYPQLRFKGFTDPWEERKLKDVVEKQIKGKAQFEKLAPGEVEYLDTSRLNGGQAILTNGLKDVTLDDILILWDGSKAGTVYHGFEGALGSTLKAYRTSANSKFVYQYLKRHQDNIYNNYRTPNIPHVQKDFLNVFTISVPVSDEQEKIGSFFKQLDDTIDLHQRKLDLLKEQKKGYLQKMFPKNGAKVPELRFAGFADAWEERKFESLLDKNEGVRRGPFGSALKKDLFVKESPYVVYEQQNAIYDHYETRYNISKEKFEELHKFELIADDFIMSGAGTIGRISKVPKGIKKGVFNQALIRFRINKELTDSEYFLQFIRADFMQRKLTGANPGSAITNLVPMSDVKKWEIKVPIKEEQKKIGAFFKQLDDTIALHQRKLDLLKEQKKSFLQNMFA